MVSLQTPALLAWPVRLGELGSGTASEIVNVAPVPDRIRHCSRFVPIVIVAVLPSPLIAI